MAAPIEQAKAQPAGIQPGKGTAIPQQDPMPLLQGQAQGLQGQGAILTPALQQQVIGGGGPAAQALEASQALSQPGLLRGDPVLHPLQPAVIAQQG